PPHPTSTYTLSLHDALPICAVGDGFQDLGHRCFGKGAEVRHPAVVFAHQHHPDQATGRHVSRQERLEGLTHRLAVQHEVARLPADRKSTRLNSSHLVISYAV